MHGIAILHNILFTLEGDPVFFLNGFIGTKPFKIVKFIDFSTDKPAFNVCMDLTSSLDGSCAFRNQPCTRFLRACGKKTNLIDQFFACLGQTCSSQEK